MNALSVEKLMAAIGENREWILPYALGYFSATGEDIVIAALLGKESHKGMFVDIGAYHPVLYSNTFLLYLYGWRGINIDANPTSIVLFQRFRRDDVNIHACISDRVEDVLFARYGEGAFNAVVETSPQSSSLERKGLLGVDKMSTQTLNGILEEYVGDNKIDLLNIDAEGMTHRIFLSLNLERFRPKIICVEANLKDFLSGPLCWFIKSKNYELHYQTLHSSVLVRLD